MASCAVVQLTDNVVLNKIVAEPSDLPPDGTVLIAIPDEVMCDIGWVWDGSTFVNTNQ